MPAEPHLSAEVAAVLGAVGGGGVGAFFTSRSANRKTDKVDTVVAIATAFEKAQASTLLLVTALQDNIKEQSARIDMLQQLVSDKDTALLHKDTAIEERENEVRRLRDYVVLLTDCMQQNGVPIPSQIPTHPAAIAPNVAPDRRSPTTHDITESVTDTEPHARPSRRDTRWRPLAPPSRSGSCTSPTTTTTRSSRGEPCCAPSASSGRTFLISSR